MKQLKELSSVKKKTEYKRKENPLNNLKQEEILYYIMNQKVLKSIQ